MPIEFGLDIQSGVPYYRQIIDHVKSAVATGAIKPGERLPTVRQLAVDLAINPNTVSRAYRELELTGVVETQMGTGTFASRDKPKQDERERDRLLGQMCQEFLAKASRHGFKLEDILNHLKRHKGGQ